MILTDFHIISYSDIIQRYIYLSLSTHSFEKVDLPSNLDRGNIEISQDQASQIRNMDQS